MSGGTLLSSHASVGSCVTCGFIQTSALAPKKLRQPSLYWESDLWRAPDRSKYFLGRMILSEKSATFRDHALGSRVEMRVAIVLVVAALLAFGIAMLVKHLIQR